MAGDPWARGLREGLGIGGQSIPGGLVGPLGALAQQATKPTDDLSITGRLAAALGDVRTGCGIAASLRSQLGIPIEAENSKEQDMPGVFGLAHALTIEAGRLRYELESLSKAIGG